MARIQVKIYEEKLTFWYPRGRQTARSDREHSSFHVSFNLEQSLISHIKTIKIRTIRSDEDPK